MKARVQTLPNVDISRNSNGHTLVLRDATVTWLGMLVVLRVLCVLISPWPIQGQRQGHGAFELRTTTKAEHAGGDDCSPLAGLSGSFKWSTTVLGGYCSLKYLLMLHLCMLI